MFGVILFFLISGFIISLVAENETRREFLIKRIFRIFPALIAATMVAFATVKLSIAYDWGPIYSNDAVTNGDFIKSAFMVSWLSQSPRAISVAWSLMPELIFYCFVFLIIRLMRVSPVKATLVLMGFCCVLTFPMAAFPYFFYLGYFTVFLPLFVIGRIFYLLFAKKIKQSQALVLFVLNLLLFLSIYNSRFPGVLFTIEYAGIFNVAFSVVLFYGLMTLSPSRCPPVIAFLSKISYSFYLMHLSVGICVLNAFASTQIPFGFKFFMAICLSILFALMGFYLIEVPAQKAARWLIRRLGWQYQVKPFPKISEITSRVDRSMA